MTENFENSVIATERDQASAQQTLRAVEHLRRSGVEDATVDTINAAAQTIPALGELQTLHEQYTRAVYEIQDDPDASDEDRQLSYADLRDEALPKAEALARKVSDQANETRRGYNRQIFGAGKGAAAQSYRDALLRAKGAPDAELGELADLADMTGDDEMLRAVAAVADRRGMKDLVYKYVLRDEKLFDALALRNTVPTDATLGILVNAYTPRTITRDQLKPSPIAKERRKAKEREAAYRRAEAFQR